MTRPTVDICPVVPGLNSAVEPTTPSPTQLSRISVMQFLLCLLALAPPALAALPFGPNPINPHSLPTDSPPQASVDSVSIENLACVTTQHQFGTQVIDIVSPDAAQSVTYYRAAHFGTAPDTTDQVVTAYGQYQDAWRRRNDGTWGIARRNLVYMVNFAYVGDKGSC